LVLPFISYTLSSTKLEVGAKQFLPGNEGLGGEGGDGGKGEGGGKGGEMAQTLYAHMNKKLKKIKNNIKCLKKEHFNMDYCPRGRQLGYGAPPADVVVAWLMGLVRSPGPKLVRSNASNYKLKPHSLFVSSYTDYPSGSSL
jgi:hypothetical protein